MVPSSGTSLRSFIYASGWLELGSSIQTCFGTGGFQADSITKAPKPRVVVDAGQLLHSSAPCSSSSEWMLDVDAQNSSLMHSASNAFFVHDAETYAKFKKDVKC